MVLEHKNNITCSLISDKCATDHQQQLAGPMQEGHGSTLRNFWKIIKNMFKNSFKTIPQHGSIFRVTM
jgi:hypothetical protein